MVSGSQHVDFIRTISIVFGIARSQDPLFPFDLVIGSGDAVQYGIDCVPRRVRRIEKAFETREIPISRGINLSAKYTENSRSPEELGAAIVEYVRERSQERADNIDISKSLYLVLLYDDQGRYQLCQIPYELPDPSNLKWSTSSLFSRLEGKGADGTVITYNRSGDRFTYHPSYKAVVWSSPIFQLEPFASLENLRYGLQARAEMQKLSAIEKLKELIEANAEEKRVSEASSRTSLDVWERVCATFRKAYLGKRSAKGLYVEKNCG